MKNLFLILILSIISVLTSHSQTVIKNRITVDSTYFDGRGVTSEPLTLKLNPINALISDSLATVTGGASTYGDVCECKYLHIIFRFNNTSNPTVQSWKSNIDFDLIDPGQGTPYVNRDGVGGLVVGSVGDFGENLIALPSNTFIYTNIAINPRYTMSVNSYDAPSVSMIVFDDTGTPTDLTNFFYGEIKFEYPN